MFATWKPFIFWSEGKNWFVQDCLGKKMHLSKPGRTLGAPVRSDRCKLGSFRADRTMWDHVRVAQTTNVAISRECSEPMHWSGHLHGKAQVSNSGPISVCVWLSWLPRHHFSSASLQYSSAALRATSLLLATGTSKFVGKHLLLMIMVTSRGGARKKFRRGWKKHYNDIATVKHPT